MAEFKLICDSEDGSLEIELEEGRFSFGRGSEAEYRFTDDGLSRLHASVYSEEGRIWVVDENSTNGTTVNGEEVDGSGLPLYDGDAIRIGHHTILRVVKLESDEQEPVPAAVSAETTVASEPEEHSALIVPLALIGVALIVIVSSVGFIAYLMYGSGPTTLGRNDPYTNNDPNDLDPIDGNGSPDGVVTPTPGSATPETGLPTPESTGIGPDPNTTGTIGPTPPPLPKKQYLQMTPAEQSLYIKVKAEKVARLIGNRSAGDIPPGAVSSIKRFVDQYAKRFRASRVDDCRGRTTFTRSDMQTVLERASRNVPFITRSFRRQAVDPQVGIYVAMIESEHCVCLQSPTGPLGMFQFTFNTGKAFGLDVKPKASPANPDERCQPLAASLASAKYLKYLSGRIGTGPLSVPLAIASYNSGEGGLGKNLMTALMAQSSEERSFWTLVANAERLSKQFKHENIKYVPKFFAAAIVGENPRDFGSNLQPLSTYTR